MNLLNWHPVMAIMLMALAVATIVILYQRRQRHLRRNQQQGLQLLVALRELLGLIQKHRGLTHGFHGGDRALLNDIQPLQKTIEQQAKEMSRFSRWVIQNERWMTIEEHWSRLSAGYATLEPENCLLQHNQLITNVLYLIEDAANAHRLHMLNPDISAACLVWKELLITAEYIGQARALGTGVAAAGQCTSVARIRMNYLKQKIEQTTRTTWNHLDVAQEVRVKLNTLLKCIEQQILIDRPSIASKAYFQLATETLDGVFEQFDREVQGLRFHL